MTASEILNLINIGATDHLRMKLKKYGIEERMRVLSLCIPHVKDSGRSLKFFKENFSVELGALVVAEGDIEKAVSLYKNAKNK